MSKCSKNKTKETKQEKPHAASGTCNYRTQSKYAGWHICADSELSASIALLLCYTRPRTNQSTTDGLEKGRTQLFGVKIV